MHSKEINMKIIIKGSLLVMALILGLALLVKQDSMTESVTIKILTAEVLILWVYVVVDNIMYIRIEDY